jgi:microcystin-dependent protein
VVYPVGAIYMSAASTNPATLFGFGTWEQIQDRFLLAAGSSYSAGSTGGEATHTLTTNEMPSHNHTSHGISIATTGNSVNLALRSVELGNQHTGTAVMRVNNTGGGKAHNNMPPYLAVYVWKRTA